MLRFRLVKRGLSCSCKLQAHRSRSDIKHLSLRCLKPTRSTHQSNRHLGSFWKRRLTELNSVPYHPATKVLQVRGAHQVNRQRSVGRSNCCGNSHRAEDSTRVGYRFYRKITSPGYSFESSRTRKMSVSALEAQTFASNPLDRSSLERRDPNFISNALRSCKLMFIAGRFLGNSACRGFSFQFLCGTLWCIFSKHNTFLCVHLVYLKSHSKNKQSSCLHGVLDNIGRAVLGIDYRIIILTISHFSTTFVCFTDSLRHKQN